ncbi:MAG: hypothetical protein KC561_06750 [Myxococcales bacterium]|nr:hypothetical protein [Myxococcales bacterium]
MADELQENVTAPEVETEEKAEPRIMCYVSKEMVPLSQTVEVEYEPGKSFRVMPKFVKFETDTAE